MPTTNTPDPVRILVINPNTSTSMTEALKPVVDSLDSNEVKATYFTCPPPGIPSINSPLDAAESAELCLPHLFPLLQHHDAFLVACYSRHPLVDALRTAIEKLSSTRHDGELGNGDERCGVSGGTGRKYVTGIFEASVLASLAVIGEDDVWGIVSTGKIWEGALQDAVEEFLRLSGEARKRVGKFVGCETTGLNASELHDLPGEVVRGKMREATARLVQRGTEEGDGGADSVNGGVGAVSLGCAGMVGLEEAVREGCVDVLGEEKGGRVRIIDGVKAGIVQLFGMVKAGF